MAYRFRRVTPLQAKRDIYRMMQYFPKTYITVKRLGEVYDDTGNPTGTTTRVYQGEALVRPATGETEGFGLGTVENLSLIIVINGIYPLQQGDIVTINDGREYEVDFPPKHFDAFTVLNLDQRSQIAQPRV